MDPQPITHNQLQMMANTVPLQNGRFQLQNVAKSIGNVRGGKEKQFPTFSLPHTSLNNHNWKQQKHFNKRQLQNVWSVGGGNDSWNGGIFYIVKRTAAQTWETRLYSERQYEMTVKIATAQSVWANKNNKNRKNSKNSKNPPICFYFASCSHLFFLWCKNKIKAKLDESEHVNTSMFHSDSNII